jgi:histidine kinase/DNA gyrase B/HSP90-like ATPase
VLVGTLIGTIGVAAAPTLYGYPTISNPVVSVSESVSDAISTVGTVGFFAAVVGLLASIVSVILRFRRPRGQERLQMKWFVFAAVIALVISIPVNVLELTGPVPGILSTLAFPAIPISVAVAILKYRLYGIDLVIRRAVVFGLLATFVTVVYLGLVVGVGSLVGRGDEGNLALSVVATAIVAMAFQPVRSRVQGLANRLVYGKRATPYEVPTAFGERMGDTYETDGVLPRLVQVLARGTGAAVARAWIRVGSELRPVEAWPSDAASAEPLAMTSADLPERYRQEIESALYFCCLEALQNAAKYAHATHADIRLSANGDVLTFEVVDDGNGFDPTSTPRGSGLQGMADRLDAIGGTLEVRSQPGIGTTVTGRVPV